MTKLSDTTTVAQSVTFPVPHVLLNCDMSGRFPVLTLRQGGHVQVEATITTDWYDESVDESKSVFVVKAKNKINFGALRLEVLNDRIDGDKPIAQSFPTASEYMEKVGKPVLLAFACVKSNLHSQSEGKDVFKVVRSTITLP